MGKLLSTRNLPNPTTDGSVLTGNADGSQYWGSGGSGGISVINSVIPVVSRDGGSNISLSNFSFNVEDRNGTEVTISDLLVSQNSSSYEVPLQTFITSVS